METYIVVADVECGDGRKICERMENMVFETPLEAMKFIEQEYLDDYKFIYLMDMSSFMDECNDQEFDLESVFIGYIKIKN